ncbi:cytoplasmic heat shock protein 70 [Histomonas meleagridis]|uniref:cytoplasmic heat shock protein 70 n=1 Tax=Histomonas meleagridis TaxID=135588 RepID=UPI003559CEE2|nr:cytoplasmic heat shock protein 70 [Histomonas meleagridis]KAH0803900.1 cytoplasmic heat shock protein 70 [Histomonas meleagridis]
MIGRTFNDPCVQSDIHHWPFKVVPGKNNLPMVEVQVNNKPSLYSAVEISSFVFHHLKLIADSYLSLDSNDTDYAVITVPAYFNAVQREAILEAGRLANLNILRIIDEPTAAAIAFGFKELYNISKKILVFDFGGGTLDLSLLDVDKRNFVVLATGGDTHFGGQDFDNKLVEYLAKKIQKKYNYNIYENKRALLILRSQCEKAKIMLSNTSISKALIFCANLFNGIDFKYELTQAKFEKINEELFEKIKTPIIQILEIARINKENIDNVILIGGTSRIPLVRKIVSDFFNGKILMNIDPEKAVAQGAAIEAASNEEEEDFPIIRYTSVISQSIGVEINRTDMDIILKHGEQIPVKSQPLYYTPIEQDQPKVYIKVYAGDNPKTKDNVFLGMFELKVTKPESGQNPKIEVRLEIDKNGILDVTAKDMAAGTSDKMRIKVEKILNL